MSKRYLFTLLMLGILLTKANGVVLKGSVMGNGNPVAFATLYCKEQQKGTVADAQGNFELRVDPGVFTIQVSAVGYQKLKKRITTNGKEVITLNLDLQPDPQSLSEITISGTMKEISRMNSPILVEVFTPRFFQKTPSSGMFEALQMVNGVQPTINCNVCNTGDIHINGMEGPYTMVLIDGMPIVSALSTVYGLSGIPSSMIERIEIVKGPASTLYGSEAVAGLINIITRKPSNAPRVSFDMFATSYAELNADAGLSYRIGKSHGLFSLNAFTLNNKWDKNNDHFTDITLQNRYSVFNKISFASSAFRQANLALRLFHENRYGGEMEFDSRLRGSDSIYGESIYTDRLELIGDLQLKSHSAWKAMYSYNFHDQNSYYGITPYMARQHVAFAQITGQTKASKRHDVLGGLAVRYTWYDDNTPATAGEAGLEINQPYVRALPGMFIQDEWNLSASSTLLTGMRADYYRDHGWIGSPRCSFKLAPDRYQTLRLSAGNGFRVVNLFTEDHMALTGARKVVITESLKPEQSWNGNINYTLFSGLGKGYMNNSVSLFYTYFSNRILADLDSNPREIRYANLSGYSISKGISLNSEWAFGFPLKITSGLTWMDTYKVEKDATGKSTTSQQIHAPDFSATFQVTYQFKRWGLTLDYTGQVYGPMRLPVLPNDYRPEYSPWFTLQHIQATQIINNRFQVYGGIKNLFDFVPAHSIMRPFDPFNKYVTVNNPNQYTFDASYNYAPVQGIRGFLGVRYLLSQ